MTRSRKWARHVIAAALVSVIAVGTAGCASNPEPEPLPETATSPSATGTPSPSAVAPTLPARAKGTSKASAKAFVRHFFSTFNYAVQTGSTGPLRDLGTSECESCDVLAGNIDAIHQSGGSIRTRGWEVTSISLAPRTDDSTAVLNLGIMQHPERVRSAKGAQPKNYAGGRQPMTIYLTIVKGEWRVMRLDKVS
jgi:hypothetical protein